MGAINSVKDRERDPAACDASRVRETKRKREKRKKVTNKMRSNMTCRLSVFILILMSLFPSTRSGAISAVSLTVSSDAIWSSDSQLLTVHGNCFYKSCANNTISLKVMQTNNKNPGVINVSRKLLMILNETNLITEALRTFSFQRDISSYR